MDDQQRIPIERPLTVTLTAQQWNAVMQTLALTQQIAPLLISEIQRQCLLASAPVGNFDG
jgi:hypothetical protein